MVPEDSLITLGTLLQSTSFKRASTLKFPVLLTLFEREPGEAEHFTGISSPRSPLLATHSLSLPLPLTGFPSTSHQSLLTSEQIPSTLDLHPEQEMGSTHCHSFIVLTTLSSLLLCPLYVRAVFALHPQDYLLSVTEARTENSVSFFGGITRRMSGLDYNILLHLLLLLLFLPRTR